MYEMNRRYELCKPQMFTLPKFLDARGNLSFIEEFKHIPFKIERTYWIYDIPGGETRGGHALINTEQFIVALSGSFDVILDDGKEKREFSLNRSYYGLYIPGGYWREIVNFSTNAVGIVLASTRYNVQDYIRSYKDFLGLKQ